MEDNNEEKYANTRLQIDYVSFEQKYKEEILDYLPVSLTGQFPDKHYCVHKFLEGIGFCLLKDITYERICKKCDRMYYDCDKGNLMVATTNENDFFYNFSAPKFIEPSKAFEFRDFTIERFRREYDDAKCSNSTVFQWYFELVAIVKEFITYVDKLLKSLSVKMLTKEVRELRRLNETLWLDRNISKADEWFNFSKRIESHNQFQNSLDTRWCREINDRLRFLKVYFDTFKCSEQPFFMHLYNSLIVQQTSEVHMWSSQQMCLTCAFCSSLDFRHLKACGVDTNFLVSYRYPYPFRHKKFESGKRCTKEKDIKQKLGLYYEMRNINRFDDKEVGQVIVYKNSDIQSSFHNLCESV